jgi:ParB/RepB/Spo0J family partition protein
MKVKQLKIEAVLTCDLVGSPLNRTFETVGAAWEDFVGSVRTHGVQVPLAARVVKKEDGTFEFGEILAGHRRHAAAVACGMKHVPVMWLELDDAAALAFLVNENLQRLNLSPVDEARLVRAMREELEITDEEIGRRISRSVGWVRTRQLLLDLGDEVLTAVRSSADDDRHLTVGAVEEILRVPEQWREEAVQLVLHPSFQGAPLLPGQARQVLHEVIVRPRMAESVWAGASAAVAAEWKKRIKKQVPKDLAENVAVVAVAYAERERYALGMVAAEDVIGLAECGPEAPRGLTWGWLAARHGLAVQVVPQEDGLESVAVVSVGLLRLAEETLAEHGGVAWLGKQVVKKSAADEAAKGRIGQAVAEMDGEGGEVPEDAPERVIDQGMEHYGMIDLGAVKRVAMWAISTEADPMNAPEWVPKWACELGVEGMWNQVDGVVNWIASLKQSNSKH